MKLKFKNRIAIFNTIAVAITTALVFLVIYFVVLDRVYENLNNKITYERELLVMR